MDIQHERQIYWDEVEKCRRGILAELRSVCRQPRKRAKTNQKRAETAFIEDAIKLYPLCKESKVVKPYTLDEHTDTGLLEEPIHGIDTPMFLFLSASQAREFLRDGRPRIPILVPSALDPTSRSLMDPLNTLKKVKTLDSLHAQNSYNSKGQKEIAARLSCEHIIQSICKGEAKVNLVHQGVDNTNISPLFLNGLEGWDFLSYMRDDSSVDHLSTKDLSDLSLTFASWIFASGGVWTTPQIHRAGTITAVRSEAGSQIWILGLPASLDGICQIQDTGLLATTLMLILLRPGDVLIIPAGSPCMSITAKDSLIHLTTTTTFAPSQNIDRQLECLLAECWLGSSFNNSQFQVSVLMKISKAIELLGEKSSAWTWPPAELHRECFKRFQDIQNSRQSPGNGLILWELVAL